MVTDCNGIEIKVGDRVRLRDRTDYYCKELPGYSGTVVAVNPDRLPLIDVDCGTEFVRGFPHTDIYHI